MRQIAKNHQTLGWAISTGPQRPGSLAHCGMISLQLVSRSPPTCSPSAAPPVLHPRPFLPELPICPDFLQVVQEYIDPPLVIDGFKFDMRLSS